MKKNTVPIAIVALFPAASNVRRIIEARVNEKNEMNQLLGDHFKDDYRELHLTTRQRKEIFSVLFNKATDANHDIRHILNNTQLGVYGRLIHKLH